MNAVQMRSGWRSDVSASLTEGIQTLGAVAGTRVPQARLPYFAAVAMAAGAEAFAELTRTTSAMSLEAIRLMKADLRVTAAKAERELGVAFRPFEQTVSATVEWTRTRMREAEHARELNTGRA